MRSHDHSIFPALPSLTLTLKLAPTFGPNPMLTCLPPSPLPLPRSQSRSPLPLPRNQVGFAAHPAADGSAAALLSTAALACALFAQGGGAVAAAKAPLSTGLGALGGLLLGGLVSSGAAARLLPAAGQAAADFQAALGVGVPAALCAMLPAPARAAAFGGACVAQAAGAATLGSGGALPDSGAPSSAAWLTQPQLGALLRLAEERRVLSGLEGHAVSELG